MVALFFSGVCMKTVKLLEVAGTLPDEFSKCSFEIELFFKDYVNFESSKIYYFKEKDVIDFLNKIEYLYSIQEESELEFDDVFKQLFDSTGEIPGMWLYKPDGHLFDLLDYAITYKDDVGTLHEIRPVFLKDSNEKTNTQSS